MKIKEIIDRIDRVLEELQACKQEINEMTSFQDPSKTIGEYIKRIENAKTKGITKARIAKLHGLRIPSATMEHDEKHKLSETDWENFLNNYNIERDRIKYTSSPVYNGKPSICKLKLDKCYCYMVEEFEKKMPILTTLFYDNEKHMDEWISKQK